MSFARRDFLPLHYTKCSVFHAISPPPRLSAPGVPT